MVQNTQWYSILDWTQSHYVSTAKYVLRIQFCFHNLYFETNSCDCCTDIWTLHQMGHDIRGFILLDNISPINSACFQATVSKLYLPFGDEDNIYKLTVINDPRHTESSNFTEASWAQYICNHENNVPSRLLLLFFLSLKLTFT